MRWNLPFRRNKLEISSDPAETGAPAVAGLIAHYDLVNWWQNALSDEERARIEAVYTPPHAQGKRILTEGTPEGKTAPVVDFLFDLATWFSADEDRRIAVALHKKGAALARRHPTQQVGYYGGRHHATYKRDIEAVLQVGSDAALEEATRILVALLPIVEAEAEQSGGAPDAWYYEQLANGYRRRKDPALAHHILTRLANHTPATSSTPSAPEATVALSTAAETPPAASEEPAEAPAPRASQMPVSNAGIPPRRAGTGGSRKTTYARVTSVVLPLQSAVTPRKPPADESGAETGAPQTPPPAAGPKLHNLPLDQIVSTESQPRKTFYQESLEELAASIKERGVLEPIVVRPLPGDRSPVMKYEIVMGERRYRASQIAGLTHIPAIVRELSDQDAATDALLENLQREDLNPIERAEAIRSLLSFMPMERIARTLGLSETTLRRSLELLELPAHVQSALIARPGDAAGVFGEGHGRALLALNDDPASQARLVGKVRAEKMNIPDLEKVIGAMQQFPDRKEAFLQVPVSVTEQLLKKLTLPEKRQKPYKAKTAEQHLKAIEKAARSLDDLLDARIMPFLSLPQMNQLLATATDAARALEDFGGTVRDALQKQDHGFRETYIHCPLCGRVELIGSEHCSLCGSVLRRCYDCGNYDRAFERCGVDQTPVMISEAVQPREESKSFRCPAYQPKFEARTVRLKVVP